MTIMKNNYINIISALVKKKLIIFHKVSLCNTLSAFNSITILNIPLPHLNLYQVISMNNIDL